MSMIDRLAVLPRPRTPWQAMDAGISLARAHYITLVILWLGFALPLFLLQAFIIFTLELSSIWWSVFFMLWWWFKPLYELPLFLYLSKALFSEKISLRSAWLAALDNLSKLFKTYLTLSRLSPRRSLSYGVVFLEKLPRKQRRERITTLTNVTTRHYLLMVCAFHLEYVVAYALLLALMLLFVPDFSTWGFLFEFFLYTDNATGASLFSLFISCVTFVASALVAPFYVSAGFLIYMNRRIELEAWDIEHRFRNIQPRTTVGVTLTLLFALGFAFSEPSQAQQRSDSIVSEETTNTLIEEILSSTDFGETKTRKLPTFHSDDKDEDKTQSQFVKDLISWLANASDTLANIIKIALWVFAALFMFLLFRMLRGFRRPSLASRPIVRQNKNEAEAMYHPLTQDLPDDIEATAKSFLQRDDRRQALSVLFRGALRSIMNEYDLAIDKGATESDCKKVVANTARKNQIDTFTKLVSVWQKEAYANLPQQKQLIAELIEEWSTAFSSKRQRKSQHADKPV